jgi:uncharacterized protein (DUF433 family)/DNA-binding transcriptional MerR regulator
MGYEWMLMDMITGNAMLQGAYDAHRAAALSGVPVRTLHQWASNGVYRPSIVSSPRTRLWSWGDLVALRAIDWLRSTKDPSEPRRATIDQIRSALLELDRDGIPRHKLADLVVVSDGGQILFKIEDRPLEVANESRQTAMVDVLHVTAPYLGRGPDLLQPGPHLRIRPGKLSGEPHLEGTRLKTAVLYALVRGGYPEDQILRMYPEATPLLLNEAVELEQKLAA